MSITYLEDWLEKLGPIPADVKRSLELIRTLDEKWKSSLAQLKSSQGNYIERVRAVVKGKATDGTVDLKALSEDPAELARIVQLRRECQQLSEEKVQVASQLFDLLDSLIRRLGKWGAGAVRLF